MSAIEVTGYGCEISWDGEVLRAKGTNAFAHRALMGQNRDFGGNDAEGMTGGEVTKKVMEIPAELVLNREEFTIEKFKTGNPITNGTLTLKTNQGVKYQLHFRRKDNDSFTKLRESLG